MATNEEVEMLCDHVPKKGIHIYFNHENNDKSYMTYSAFHTAPPCFTGKPDVNDRVNKSPETRGRRGRGDEVNEQQ